MEKTLRALGLLLLVVGTPAIAFAQGGRGGAAPGPITPIPGVGTSEVTVPKGTSVLLGQVVDAASGQPVQEATVMVRISAPGTALGGSSAGRAGGARGQGAAPSSQTPSVPRIHAYSRYITDANGHFVVRDVPKGAINCTVDAPGYLTKGADRQIDEGEHVRDFKIEVQKYAVITGTILDDVGDPAVNVSVRAMQRDRSGFTFVSEDKTDDRGTYRLSTLRPGEYAIAVPQTQATVPVATFNSMMSGLMGGGGNVDFRDLAASGAGLAIANGLRVGDLQVGSSSGLTPVLSSTGQIFVAPTMFYPSAATPGAATVVKVASGEERSGIDMQLRVVPTVKVSGTVTAPAGSGMMQVQLRPAAADAAQANIDVASTLASANGGFTFLGVPAGQYIVRIVRQPPPPLPPELASNPFMQMALGSRGGALQTMMFAQASVNVSTSDVNGVALTMTPGLTVSGHVVFDGSSPKPTAPNMTVLLSSDDREATQGSGRLDSTGNFKTAGVMPAHYAVTSVGVPPPWVLASIAIDGHDVSDDGLDLSSDVADAVATFTDRAGTVSGRLQAPNGPPPSNVTVFLLPADVDGWIAKGMSSHRMRQGRVSSNGTFTLGNVLPGEYVIAAVGETVTFPPDADLYRAMSRGAAKITVALGDHLTVDAPVVKVR